MRSAIILISVVAAAIAGPANRDLDVKISSGGGSGTDIELNGDQDGYSGGLNMFNVFQGGLLNIRLFIIKLLLKWSLILRLLRTRLVRSGPDSCPHYPDGEAGASGDDCVDYDHNDHSDGA